MSGLSRAVTAAKLSCCLHLLCSCGPDELLHCCEVLTERADILPSSPMMIPAFAYERSFAFGLSMAAHTFGPILFNVNHGSVGA